MNLAQIKLGQTDRVSVLHISAQLMQRLAALIIRIDCDVTVLRRGWLGGPLQLRVGNTELMLRRDAAEGIEVLLMSDAMPQACSLAEVAA